MPPELLETDYTQIQHSYQQVFNPLLAEDRLNNPQIKGSKRPTAVPNVDCWLGSRWNNIKYEQFRRPRYWELCAKLQCHSLVRKFK